MKINSFNLEKTLSTAATGLSAESAELNLITSNLANANGTFSNPEEAYKAKMPVFSEIKQKIMGLHNSEELIGGVKVDSIIESQKAIPRRYEPDNQLADSNGYVYSSNVDSIEEIGKMSSASKAYQAGVEVMNTVKKLLQDTLRAIQK